MPWSAVNPTVATAPAFRRSSPFGTRPTCPACAAAAAFMVSGIGGGDPFFALEIRRFAMAPSRDARLPPRAQISSVSPGREPLAALHRRGGGVLEVSRRVEQIDGVHALAEARIHGAKRLDGIGSAARRP